MTPADLAELTDPFARLLEAECPPATVRAIEAGGDASALWAAIEASGFLDALVSESAGGVGLSLSDAYGLFALLGRYAVPLPVGETMIARALLGVGEARETATGPIALATAMRAGDRWQARGVINAMTARHILVTHGDALTLCDVVDVVRSTPPAPFSLSCDCEFGPTPRGINAALSRINLRALAAVVRATAIAGAVDHVLSMTAGYAGQRIQFGKAIGKQQAVQQQLAVMAEYAIFARLAAQTGFAAGLPISEAAAATAKAATSRAALRIAEIAHAVHGAIGISADYDLHLLTRRLHEWRAADGSEGYWEARLGALRLASNAGSTVDFIRGAIAGAC